ncbi:kinesin 9A [Monocercomonoides exilis]|uniref:kinesin 9A n=1 Tax=Monocercomonoides exilis TaxID=2049356 RepID=UPI00355A6FC3|nr:kinesin 9A [Monocercomonoides exilis]|eukprot:MONOS_5195.1-p1 / transcript=MONOS_5195.1 / gene=MONOS_5195 / organism=Monocercomonoides_exilis_PA203 / gene_product=kinesin 9A / transcript_product=kinesin 9A / location=Mono_scaffold00148:83403-86473(-) / protein_length=856 / sequence_SO=supercontig / SO=protein_coding / is_pseudo=false
MTRSKVMKETIKVYARTRPTNAFATESIIINQENSEIDLVFRGAKKDANLRTTIDRYPFIYSGILHNSTQENVFSTCCKPVISSAFEGYNGTIMAYGQTGAGKTYTMVGSEDSFEYRGIIPRAITEVFREIESRSDIEVTVRIIYFEIYNEVIRDLISGVVPPNPDDEYFGDPQVMEASDGNVFVRGISKPIVTTEEEALQLFFAGNGQRSIKSFSNSHSAPSSMTSSSTSGHNSSRSHCVLTIALEMKSRVDSRGITKASSITLVDLAGSEKLGRAPDRTESEATIRETGSINKSLSYLQQVIVALGDKRRDHIPYRSSKLTQYLRNSLGGSCRTVLITNIRCEEENKEETLSSLRFGERMMKVENEAVVRMQLGEGADGAETIKRLQREIKDLKMELAMHDALCGRGRVNYSPLDSAGLTSAAAVQKQKEMAEDVRLFIDGEIDADELLGIDDDSRETVVDSSAMGSTTPSSTSAIKDKKLTPHRRPLTIQMLREMLNAFKTVARQLKADAIHEVALQAQQGALDGSQLISQDLKSPAASSNSASTASSPTPTGVGEVDKQSGFGMGLAMDGAPSHLLKQTLLSTSAAGSAATSPFPASSSQSSPSASPDSLSRQSRSPYGSSTPRVVARSFGEREKEREREAGSEGRAGGKNVADESALFEYYKKETQEGRYCERRIAEVKENCRSAKVSARETAIAVNEKKREIDILIQSVEKKKREMEGGGSSDGALDSEWYELQKTLAMKKDEYKQLYSALKLKQAEVDVVTEAEEEAKRQLLLGFSDWKEKETRESGNGMLSSHFLMASQTGKNDEYLSEEEQKEEEFRSQLMKEQPDAVAFYSAMKLVKGKKSVPRYG